MVSQNFIVFVKNKKFLDDAIVMNIICDVHFKLKSQNGDSSELESSEFLHENKMKAIDSWPHFEKMDVTFLNYPGIYEILDIENNKSYYGQTTLLARRIMQHNQGLVNETHECKDLIAAFKKQDKQIDKFRFIVHKSGPEWEDETLRLAYEKELIVQNYDRCYNNETGFLAGTEQKQPRNIRKPLTYKGKKYTSVRKAAEGQKIARSTILRHLANPKITDVYYLDKESFGMIPIFAKRNSGFSVLFNSIKDCVAANYATNTQNARRKIQRQEPGWRYARLDDQNKPLRVSYQLKPGEITYQQYCQICSFVYRVNFIYQNSESVI